MEPGEEPQPAKDGKPAQEGTAGWVKLESGRWTFITKEIYGELTGGSSIWLPDQKPMKANELLKKLGHTLLGKKANTSAAGDVATVIQLAPDEKAP